MKIWQTILLLLISLNAYSMEFNHTFNQLYNLTLKMEQFIEQGEHLKTDNNLDNMSHDYFATCAQYKTVVMNIIATYNHPESKKQCSHWCAQQDYYTRIKMYRTFQRMGRINQATIQTWSHLKKVEKMRTWLLDAIPEPAFNIPHAIISPFLGIKNIAHLACCAMGLYACHRLHAHHVKNKEFQKRLNHKTKRKNDSIKN